MTFQYIFKLGSSEDISSLKTTPLLNVPDGLNLRWLPSETYF